MSATSSVVANRPSRLVGHCSFGSREAALLLSLLPELVHVRGEARLATPVELVGGETRSARPARDLVLGRLLEVLLIEALRSTTRTDPSPGLLRGWADPRLAVAIRRMHERPDHGWMAAALASEAALSRSTIRAVPPLRGGRVHGVPPDLASARHVGAPPGRYADQHARA